MKRLSFMSLLCLLCTLWVDTASAGSDEPVSITWKQCLRQEPEWYKSAEAIRIADNVLLYQRDSGVWGKNVAMAAILSEREKTRLVAKKGKIDDSTIDNGATYTQLKYLAKVYNATEIERFKGGFLRGLDFLFEVQYENGGWPQFPFRSGYPKHITFNDNAMTGVLALLREIAGKNTPYVFVDESRRSRAETAVRKGIECILKCQIVVDGKRTAWCAQHDERTLEPAPARTYEKISLSGGESVGIVRFLMGTDRPGPEIVEAIQAAVAWFDEAKLTGIRQVQKPDPSLQKGYDKIVVSDPDGPPLWARFYEIGTNHPIFSGRDGVIKYRLAEIEHERRTGYSWYTTAPAELLAKHYPAWLAKWAPGENVLMK